MAGDPVSLRFELYGAALFRRRRSTGEGAASSSLTGEQARIEPARDRGSEWRDVVTKEQVHPPRLVLSRGRSQPLGSRVDADGVNFSIYSEHATGVELLLFSSHDKEQRAAFGAGF